MVPNRRVRAILRRSLVLGVVAVAAACEMPRFQGPQIQNPPRGFLLEGEPDPQRPMLPDRDVGLEITWMAGVGEPHSRIRIRGHPGAISIDDVAMAQETAAALPENRGVTFSEIEPLTIDGRTAWGWSERLDTPARGLEWVAYRTVVSYDTVSYAIEYHSTDPATRSAAPDTLRTVVASFAVGRTRWNVPLIALLAGLSLFGAFVVRTRRAERTERLRSITLASFESDEGHGEIDLDETEPAPSPEGSGTRGSDGSPG